MANKDLRVEGKTVEEAVHKAATLLEVLPEDLSVEIIDPGSQGFLGFNRRPAVIMARRARENPEEDGSTRESASGQVDRLNEETVAAEVPGKEERQQGYVWVENGKICVKGDELPATIITGNHFELYVNGQPVADEVAVRAGDSIEVRPRVEKEDGAWQLLVSSDGLKAELVIKPGYIHTWELKDHSPATQLLLEGDPVDVALPAITREQLEAELNRQQVTYGIDAEALQKACTATENLKLVIARGKLPQAGEDARVECFFSTDEITRVDVGEEERVDYREMVVRVSVAIGDLLAVKIPPRPGVPGVTVTGKPVAPPEPGDIELVAGQGTEVIDGQRAVAKIEGRPKLRRLHKKAIIDVLPVLFHKGDVNLESGNLKFKGSINISGSITDTMQVVATQDLEVAGDVTRATVSAGGSIIIRNNCIGSSLVAGGASGIFQVAEPILSDLAESLCLLRGAAQQIEKSAGKQLRTASQVDMGYLLNVLVENKFKKIPLLVTSLEKLTRDIEEGVEEQSLIQLARELSRAFHNAAAIRGLKLEELDNFIRALQEMADYCQEVPRGKGNITLNYSLNSNLRASGQVKILGRGCFNTNIKAGDRVEIKGVFRGGSIYAGNDVYLQEMGSPGEVRTLVRVAEGKLIKVAKIWPSSVLQIGKRIRSIETEKDRVLAYLDSEKNLTLGTF